MTLSLQGGGTHCCGFTELGTTIVSSESIASDTDYVAEHSPLKYTKGQPIMCTTFIAIPPSNWTHKQLPPSNWTHKQLHGGDIRRLLRRLQHHIGHLGGGRGNCKAEIRVLSSLNIGHKYFFGGRIVYCKPFPSNHGVRMDFVLFIPPTQFYEGTRADAAEFEASLDSCWK